jgi:hypothetical protein
MPTVDLVYAPDCPNVALARANLLLAFARAGLRPAWAEHRAGDGETPARTRGYGSPTVLIDGRDVAGQPPSTETCCRLYVGAAGWAHAPSTEQIAAALAESRSGTAALRGGARWRSSLATLPGIGVAFLPKLTCPACWPAYSGLLTSLGLGFFIDIRWLLPLTAAFLLIAVIALAFRARQRRGFGPVFVGLGAAAIVLGGKFGFESDLAMYTGLGLLVAASIWNTWPRRAAIACPACPTR